MARIIFLVLLSALAFCKDTTAQTAAGIQPNIVICKIRQRIPENILPLKRKESHGNKIAISIMLFYLRQPR